MPKRYHSRRTALLQHGLKSRLIFEMVNKYRQQRHYRSNIAAWRFSADGSIII